MPNTYYATKISPHRGKTDEGYLICSKVPVARIGYQFYLDKELMSLSKFWEMVKDREAWRASVHGVAKSRTRLSD